MRTLKVKKFSCIAEAVLPITPITLLIGPQASGKSVLCKLCYFFASLLDEQVEAIVERLTQEEFIEEVKSKFMRWFPWETWGKQKFEITFQFGACSVQVSRTMSGGKPGKGVKVSFCELLTAHFEQSARIVEENDGKRLNDPDRSEFGLTGWRKRRSIRSDLQKRLGDDFVTSQIFIPAGRSFFTSIGKAIAAFENSNILDPITIAFGRMYAARDRELLFDSPKDRAIHTLITKATVDMLGGHLVKERENDREVLKTHDGRTIPLSALSSGQQEVFPLLQVLPTYVSDAARRLIYVEEPEAHLFPEAQSRLVVLLAALANLYGVTSNTIITTHSPYVLSKFNNLLLAGRIGRKKSKIASLADSLPHESWIQRDQLGAYALDHGKLTDLMDADGLINGDYLDSVSNSISAEFSKILGVQFGN